MSIRISCTRCGEEMDIYNTSIDEDGNIDIDASCAICSSDADERNSMEASVDEKQEEIDELVDEKTNLDNKIEELEEEIAKLKEGETW